MVKTSVRLLGSKELLAKLAHGGSGMTAGPLRRVVTTGLTDLQREAPGRFNSLSGSAVGSISGSMTGPLSGRVALMNQHGVILNNGGRGKRSRFTGGAKSGRPTKGWFSNIVRLGSVKRRMNDLLGFAAKEIERAWGR